MERVNENDSMTIAAHRRFWGRSVGTARFRCRTQTPPDAVLWIVQGLLAMLFLFAGGTKLTLPVEAMSEPVALPGLFLRFLGVAEVMGAIGLILPLLLRVHTYLTPVAAAGLVIIMIGATVITASTGAIGGAVVPLIVGVLAAAVVYGRREEVERLRGADNATPTPAASVT
jgi:uncharacterized membrane protein YphA (DoxX/SURF4 family)